MISFGEGGAYRMGDWDRINKMNALILKESCIELIIVLQHGQAPAALNI